MYNNISIIGSTGTIGSALTHQLAQLYPSSHISAFSRKNLDGDNQNHPKHSNVRPYNIEYVEESIKEAAYIASHENKLDLIVVTTGVLHSEGIKPEKSLKDLSAANLQHIYEANTILPTLIAKHFIPCLNRNRRSCFAVLSARVGSISDNHSGGWYSYRASKAALNMIIKTASIETRRTHPESVIVGLHPGTVDSQLSKPFQRNVPKDKLFTAQHSARCLINVLNTLSPNQSGKIIAWDGKEITP
ncbi:SDR family NAD(P)-dependent oxidoreductase [Vibrio sp. ZSDE26]|uniref:SDR family NAD(P)-dependent oxidoreductase n=1 Tax=Vibrio amylolyticus TaxID=2847292 RepID=A0A9X1XJJ9_9VIBR|nr:SDR family NAD(P)-dependent oxidoreductase [Vibrio amylolyticus]MCK6262135.1 SDR family NAD(P)-dependent oxidoreductase [Vibrio amylolyticus]